MLKFTFFFLSLVFLSHAELKKKNILFIFSDDHALQAIGAYGSKINKTPNIDRLAAQGTVFRNSFCGNSLCGPSRAMVLTGKHSHANGFRQNYDRFDGSQQTFPKLLQKAGYQTAVIGKWHLISEPTGFDHFDILPGQGAYYNPNMFKKGEDNGKTKHERGTKYSGYVTDIITDKSIEWLDKTRDKAKPFMLMCQHKAPHEPWDPPLKNLYNYDGVTIPEPPTLFDDYKNRSRALAENTTTISNYLSAKSLHYKDPAFNQEPTALKRMTAEQRAAWNKAYGPKNEAMLKAGFTAEEMTQWRYQRYVKDYLRCIDSIDENVGRILDYLEKNDLMKDTVVIYSSDQGFFLGEHGWYDKRWMFEESMKMPFIISWPGVTKAGTVNDNLIQNIDYAPTFCEIAGITPPADLQGKSLKSIIENPDSEWRESVYYHYYEYPNIHNVPPHEGVRTGRYKLINFYKNDGYNLFDLEQDPHELKDLSRSPEYADVLESMKSKLAGLRKELQVPPLDKTKIKPVLRPLQYIHKTK